MSKIAVISGDLVKSQQIGSVQLEQVITHLNNVLSEFAALALVQDFDIYRGDAFQIVATRPQDSCVIAVLLRLAITSAESSVLVRQSVAIGNVQNIASSVKLSSGEAFVLSGRGLDEMRTELLTLRFGEGISDAATSLMTRLVDALLQELSRNESEVLYFYLLNNYIKGLGRTHAQLAELMQKSRSHITRQLNRAYYELIEEYFDFTRLNIGK